jgi:hypothetical protein
MRAMQTPWGKGLAVIGALLGLLLVIGVISTLFALSLFLVRRSRVVAPIAAQNAVKSQRSP